jgi:hypothetical protein
MNASSGGAGKTRRMHPAGSLRVPLKLPIPEGRIEDERKSVQRLHFLDYSFHVEGRE